MTFDMLVGHHHIIGNLQYCSLPESMDTDDNRMASRRSLLYPLVGVIEWTLWPVCPLLSASSTMDSSSIMDSTVGTNKIKDGKVVTTST